MGWGGAGQGGQRLRLLRWTQERRPSTPANSLQFSAAGLLGSPGRPCPPSALCEAVALEPGGQHDLTGSSPRIPGPGQGAWTPQASLPLLGVCNTHQLALPHLAEEATDQPPRRHLCASRCRACPRCGQPASPLPWHLLSTRKNEQGCRRGWGPRGRRKPSPHPLPQEPKGTRGSQARKTGGGRSKAHLPSLVTGTHKWRVLHGDHPHHQQSTPWAQRRVSCSESSPKLPPPTPPHPKDAECTLGTAISGLVRFGTLPSPSNPATLLLCPLPSHWRCYSHRDPVSVTGSWGHAALTALFSLSLDSMLWAQGLGGRNWTEPCHRDLMCPPSARKARGGARVGTQEQRPQGPETRCSPACSPLPSHSRRWGTLPHSGPHCPPLKPQKLQAAGGIRASTLAARKGY